MKIQLQNSLVDTYIQISQANGDVLLGSIDRSRDGALRLSGRTMIRNAILEYRSDGITLETLAAYTQDKYVDGAKALEYLVLAERYVDGVKIASFGTGQEMPPDNDCPVALTESLQLDGEQLLMTVTSPIVLDGALLGFDKLLFNLTEHMDRQLDSERITTLLLSETAYLQLKKNGAVVREDGARVVVAANETYYVVTGLQDGIHFVSAQPEKTLFSTVNGLTLRITLVSVGFLLCLTLIFYFYLIRHAHNQLSLLEKSRNSFREIAYQDSLTKALNREFLALWKERLRLDAIPYCFVFLDIDNFKKANDVYGHTFGDRVLGKLSDIIMKSIKKTDYLIRYGGDEFLLILANVDEGQTQMILDRIVDQLEPENIRISYGVCALEHNDNPDACIHEADERMYQMKTKKQQEASTQ